MRHFVLATVVVAYCLIGAVHADLVVFSLADTDDVSLSHTSSNDSVAPPMAGSQDLGNGIFSWGELATDSSANTAVFSSGSFSSSDWGGLGTFTSFSFDVSAFIAADISGIFDGEFNTASEFSNFFYALDGGVPVEFGAGAEDTEYINEAVGVPEIDISSVSNMTVGFSYKHNGSDDYFNVSSLTVSFAAIPEPTAFLFGSLVTGLVGVTVARRRVRRA